MYSNAVKYVLIKIEAIIIILLALETLTILSADLERPGRYSASWVIKDFNDIPENNMNEFGDCILLRW